MIEKKDKIQDMVDIKYALIDIYKVLELFQEELNEEPKTIKDKEGNTRIIDWIWKPLMKQHKIESVTPPFAKKGNLLSIKFTEKKEKTKKLEQGKGKKGKKNKRTFDMEEDY